eukprot:Sdes_comp12855_c0_seq1m3022
MIKRAWIESESSQGIQVLFEQIFQLESLDAWMQTVLMSLLVRILDEFSTSSKSSEIGFTWEYHYNCKISFETKFLKRIFFLVLQMLQKLSQAELKVLSSENPLLFRNTITLAERILTWDFTPQKSLQSGSFSTLRDTLFRPGPSWRDVLLNESTIQLFFSVHSFCRGHPEESHKALQCLIELASLSGSIYESFEEECLYSKCMIIG